MVGYVQIKEEKWDLRWAHQEMAGTRQIVTVATDRPIYFSGGARADAKRQIVLDHGLAEFAPAA